MRKEGEPLASVLVGTLKAALKFVAIAVVGLVLAGLAAIVRRPHGAGKEVSHQTWPNVPRRPTNEE